MIAIANLIAGIGWEPEIRGLLTVALGLAILAGSVWLLLVTNTGTRLGSLIALAGFWGWMFVMGIFWWIYGIGWAGSLPSWQVEDVFIDEPGIEVTGLQDAFLGNVDDLPDTNCFDGTDSFPPENGVASFTLDSSNVALCTPRAIEVLMAYPGPERERVIRELLNPSAEESKFPAIGASYGITEDDPIEMLSQLSESQRDDVFDTIVKFKYDELADSIIANNEALGSDDPRYLTGADLDARVAYATDAQTHRIDNISLSSLAGSAPAIIDWAQSQGVLDLDGWNLQSGSQSGEAAATADAYLREELFPDGDFVVLDAFQQGGKDKRDGNGMLNRVWFKTKETVKVVTGFGSHPPNYTVVNVQQTIHEEADPSLPPPVPVADSEASTYSVVMVRNLGNLRLVPALFTLASLAIFLLTCLVLHWRDLGLREKGVDS